MPQSRRQALTTLCTAAATGSLLSALSGCEKRPDIAPQTAGERPSYSNEEYVWLSANANLPLFTQNDHPALLQAAKELGVKVTIAGPSSVDIPGLVSAVEQTAARKPAGMMVVGWDPSALIPAINRAIDAGIPTLCIDADVPGSKRLCFVGTDWYDLGRRQGEAMLNALGGKRGPIAMLGLIEMAIMQAAFAGFRSVVEPAGCTCLPPQQDKGSQVEAARVASAVLQSNRDLVGIAGFDSESGPGIALTVKEAGLGGKIVVTCSDAEPQHLQFIREGIITAAVGQKRALFTYFGLKLLWEARHAPISTTRNDEALGISRIPLRVDTGTYTVTRENLDTILR
jgi:ribose transport system substrate-binding protein